MIGQDCHHKLDNDGQAIEWSFVDLFWDALARAPTRIVIDLPCCDDSTLPRVAGAIVMGMHDSFRPFDFQPSMRELHSSIS